MVFVQGTPPRRLRLCARQAGVNGRRLPGVRFVLPQVTTPYTGNNTKQISNYICSDFLSSLALLTSLACTALRSLTKRNRFGKAMIKQNNTLTIKNHVLMKQNHPLLRKNYPSESLMKQNHPLMTTNHPIIALGKKHHAIDETKPCTH